MTAATKTLADFIEGCGLYMDCERTYSNPNADNDEWAKTASHWRCCLVCHETGERMSLVFSQGSAHKDAPKKADVMECLLSDARSIQDCATFEEWAADLGFDPDSRKAERSYMECLAQTRKLQVLLGPLYQEFLSLEEEVLA